jgi:hypothetical protein
MSANPATAGECLYDNFKLEYQVVALEYICGKSINIEVVCYNPYSFDKEATLKFTTTNLNVPDRKLDISLLIINSLIKNLKLDPKTLRKLTIRDHKIFYIHII